MPVIKKQQTTVDFAAQNAGSVEGLFDIALNNGIGITDEPAPGTELLTAVIDQKVTKVYDEGNIDITSMNQAQYERPGGIGYMQMGNDFKVS